MQKPLGRIVLWLELRLNKASKAPKARAEVGSTGGDEIRETGATTGKALFGRRRAHFLKMCGGEDLG